MGRGLPPKGAPWLRRDCPVTYARSSHSREELEKQAELLRQTLSPEYTTVAAYCDVAHGTSPLQRPRLQAALSDLVAGDFDAIYVESLDRLARIETELSQIRLQLGEQKGLLVPKPQDTSETQ